MSNFDKPSNDIEQAIEGVLHAPDGDPEGAVRRTVLTAFARATLVVLLRPVPEDRQDGESDEFYPVHVSDGPDTGQPMLAVFSSQERAQAFLDDLPSAQAASKDSELREITGPQALMGTLHGAGLIINPTQALSFRMNPALVDILRADVASAAGKAQQEQADAD